MTNMEFEHCGTNILHLNDRGCQKKEMFVVAATIHTKQPKRTRHANVCSLTWLSAILFAYVRQDSLVVGPHELSGILLFQLASGLECHVTLRLLWSFPVHVHVTVTLFQL